MSPEEIRALLTDGDIQPPYTIHCGAKSYEVRDPAYIWWPPDAPWAVVVATPRRGIAVIRVESIDSITCEEHEAVSARE